MDKERDRIIAEDLAHVADWTDEDIDTSDIPEITDWSGAIRGELGRSQRKKITEDGARLAAMKDEDIDTPDIPDDVDWSNAEVAKFYRPRSDEITLELDVDVIEWFQSAHENADAAMNAALREYMEHHPKTR